MKRDQEADGNYPFDFDENAKKPLALRRGSDAQARRSLIDKYNDEINQSSNKDDTIHEYNLKQENPHSSDESHLRLEDEIKSNRNKKIKIALIVAAVLIVIVTLILIFALHKKPHHEDPEEKIWDKIVNPYTLQETTDFTDPRSFSFRKYLLQRDRSLETIGNYSGFANETLDNKFIDFVALQTSIVGNFGTLRLQVYDQNSTSPYLNLNDYLSPDFIDASSAYNLDYTYIQNQSFAVENQNNNSRLANQSAFSLKAFYTTPASQGAQASTVEEFITTKDQSLIMMSHYQEISFQVHSHRFLGWGEKKSDKLFLTEGNHTIFPKMTEEGSGAHPFLIFETSVSSKFAGIFVLNTSPMSLELKFESNFWSKLTFRATGGSFDIFVFYGPTFDDVLKQYFSVVGKPHMLPLFAHGFFSMSSVYNESAKAIEAVEQYKTANLSLAGLVLPLSYQNDYFTNSNQIVSAIRKVYPKSSDLQLIYPFSYFAPNNGDQQLEWVNKLVNYTNGDTLVVKAEGYKLYVEMLPDETSSKNAQGWCMDVFHSEFENGFLAPLLKATTELNQGYWLQKNTPVILKDDHEFSDPWVIPYRPSNFEYTLEEQAEHVITENYQKKKVYHSAVHSIYGSKLAKSFVESLPAYRVQQSTPFVISDSTFSGIGSKGVAHLLPAPADGSFQDIQKSLVSMIKMGIFGIPNVGAQMCASSNATYEDEELCLRYFQLSVVSPLAFVKTKSIEQHIFNFKNEAKRAIRNSLKQRMELMVYMRTELKKIQLYGGTLLRPVFTAFPSQSTSESISEVLFGSSILAAFNFVQGSTTRDITLPIENSWLNLNNFQTEKGGVKIPIAGGPSDGLPLFQKSGTVIAIQDPRTENSTDEIKNVPISLSIALQDGKAFGHVYLESGLENDFKNEFHKIWVEDNIISFKQEDILGQQPDSNETMIEQIILTFVDQPVNISCAIMKDMKTVFPLYPIDYNDIKKQVLLETSDPLNPSTNKLKINEVAFIFYGASTENIVCDSSLFSYHMEEELISPYDHIFEARLTQVASKFLPNLPEKNLRVELLSDHSIHFTLTDKRIHGKEVRETPTEIYDRNFTSVKSSMRTIQLLDILNVTIEKDNFCVNITNPGNHSQVLFSTCKSLQIQHKSLNVFNFEQRSSNKFFGIGERKGSFFLEDKTTYILYNNDNNVLNSYPVHGQVYVHGRNSFFPIIYSTIHDSNNMTALIYYTGHGLEITYSNIPNDQGGHFSIASGQTEIDFVYIFNLDPIATTEAVHRHVNLGDLHQTKSKSFVLPPPSWALGHHISLPESIQSNDLVKYLENIKTLTKFPLEGIQISQHDLERELSYELSKKIFTPQALEYIAKHNLSVVPIVNTGLKNNDYVLNNLRIKTLDDKDFEGYNAFGQVIYVDYSHPDAKVLVQKQLKEFRRQVTSIDKLTINMQRNEITLGQCTIYGGCQQGLQNLPKESYLINKPGNIEMNYNTLPQVKRYHGLESQLHNVNGLMEQMAYANSGENFALLISASVSMGSGKIGFVAKQFEYFDVNDDDIKLANYQLQMMSIMGMPLLSVKYRSKIESSIWFALQSVMLGVYETSISVQDYYGIVTRYASEEDLKNFRTLLKIKYVLMAYSRTQLMNQINFGTPFIRPQFFEFSGVTTDALSHQYMYGPSIISTTSAAYSSMTFPPAYWCTIAGGLFPSLSVCFNSYNPPAALDMHIAMFIRESTITPLYWFNQTENTTFQGAADLLHTPLALHIFNQKDGEYGIWRSSGELLIDGGVGGTNNRDYCFIRMEMVNETVTVEDKSELYGGNGKCQGMQGYEMRYIVLYNYKGQTKSTGYNAAKINNQIDMVLLEVDPGKEIGIFMVKDGSKVNMYDIKNIIFSEEPAPAPTNF